MNSKNKNTSERTIAKPTLSRTLRHTAVDIDDTFWSPWQRVNRERTLYHIYEQCRQTGRIAALGGDWPQEFIERGTKGDIAHLFWDSDIAKWLEAASYSLATHLDPDLDALVDQVIAQVEQAQKPDGYLNSWFTAVEPHKRWSNLRDWHELYNAGHLIEAGVAHYEATGKQTLLNVVRRFADYIDSMFGTGPGKQRGYPGHPEIELALVRLYHATDEVRYLNLARYFVDERGSEPHYFDKEALARGEDPAAFWAHTHKYNQSHSLVRDQNEAVGHAVRAAYLYSAMADLAAEDGDESLLAACERLWKQLTSKQMYVMGGIGSSRHNEGFTQAYDLPNDTAYAETCAGIALVFWAQRMLKLDCHRRYGDVMELALYNAALSGISMDGAHFFYVNPLTSDGSHRREEWFGCPCCPPNLSRLIASLGSYVYDYGDDKVSVHLYVQSQAQLDIGGRNMTIRQETNYPWDGEVNIRISIDEPTVFTLRLRLPSWCVKPELSINGERVNLAELEEGGYASINRSWQKDDIVSLELPMPIERLYAHPQVSADVGSVALRRGPIVYCLEQADHDVPLHRILLSAQSSFNARYDPELLGGVVLLEGQGMALSDDGWNDMLYRKIPPTVKPFTIRAIPYYAWEHRTPGPMTVWIREQPATLEATSVESS